MISSLDLDRTLILDSEFRFRPNFGSIQSVPDQNIKMAKADNSFPHEIANEVKDFHLKLVELKKGLQPIINNLYQIRDDVEKAKDPFKAATLELTMCQAINSLFYSKFAV